MAFTFSRIRGRGKSAGIHGTRSQGTRRLSSFESLESRVLLSSYIVSTSGSDGASGLTDGTAWRTLQKAATTMQPGDTVTVRAGTYAGVRYTGTGGTAGAPITFKADPGVTINTVASGGNAGFHFESGSPGYFVIDGFRIDGSNGSMPKAGVRLIGAHHFTIQNCDISNPGGYWGIFIFNGTDGQVLNNKAHDSGVEHGIYLSGYVHRVTVRGNAFYNNNADGIHTNAYSQPGPATGLVIDGNTIYGNGLSGMDIEGMQDSTVTNNVVYGNTKHGIVIHHLDNLPNFPSKNNLIANNTIVANRFAIQLNGGNAQNWLLNNVLISTSTGGYGAIGTDNETAGLISDYNAVSDSFSTTMGVSKMSLSSWRSTSGQDAHSFVATAAQLFANAAANDYRLKLGSPAIDAGSRTLPGVPTPAPSTDREGTARAQGAAWDVGAYEYGSGPATPDTTAPVLSLILAGNLTAAGALITWATNEPADAVVEYGLTTAYGSSAASASLVTAHSVALSGLAAGTAYHYRVKSRDAAGNLAVSGDFTFTTPAPDTAAPVISAVAASGVTPTAATVRWTTDEASSTQVEYGTTTAYGSSTPLLSSPVTVHSAALAGLAASTVYHYRVRSVDAAGNVAVSGDFTFTTAAPPSLVFSPVPALGDFANYAPLNASRWTVADDGSGNARLFLNTSGYSELDASRLGEIALANGTSLGDFDITLKARTGDDLAANAAADYAVIFGYVDARNYRYLLMNATTGFTTFVAVVDGGATTLGTATSAGIPDGAYHDVKVSRRGGTVTATLDGREILSATDPSLATRGGVGVGSFNDSAYFDDFNAVEPPIVVPPPPPPPPPVDSTAPVISAVSTSSVTVDAATITWLTDEPADTCVQFGTTIGYDLSTARDAAAVLSHGMSLAGLAPGTTYHYRVVSCDAAGNVAVSGDFTLTTAPAPLPPPAPEPTPDPEPVPVAPSVELVADPFEAGVKALVVRGTAGDDSILFSLSSNKANVVVRVNGAVLGQYAKAGLGRIVAYGLDGNDRIEVAPSLPQRAFLDGGAGNDTLLGGCKADILLGRDGADSLLGRLAADVLIGGTGGDSLDGGDGSDLLIGGATAYDADGGALSRVSTEWRSGKTYATRLSNLRNGAAGLPALNAGSVFADADRNSLRGAKGIDWFFPGASDVITDKASAEQLN